MGEEEESVLVLLAQRGDSEALEKLLRSLYGPLRKYVAGLVDSSHVDDVLQETSLKIFRNLQWLREARVVRIWAYRIASRVAFSYLKKEKRWRKLEGDGDALDMIPGTGGPAPEEMDAEFLRLVEQVSAASRAVLLLHYQQHLSLGETAAVLDIPLGTAKSRLSYGVNQIRNILKERVSHGQVRTE